MISLTETGSFLFLEKLQGLLNSETSGFYPKLKMKAWSRFCEIGLPTKSFESFQYVPLRKLFEKNLAAPISQKADPQPYIYPECEGSVFVFVNGIYNPSLSQTHNLPEKVGVLSYSEAFQSYGAHLSNEWNRFLKEEKDPFVLLNAALQKEGLFLYIPPKTIFEKPIQLLYLNTEKNTISTPRSHFFVGQLSEISLVSRHVCLDSESSFINNVTHINLEEGAKCKMSQVSIDLPKLWIFDATRIFLKRNADIETCAVTSGSETVRNDYEVSLNGENAQVHLNGIAILKDNNESHTHVLMEHEEPHGQSLQLYKCALDDASKSSFEGKILVQKKAQKTDSFQLNNNLLLSDNAFAYSKPNLEIFADDVKASHGSTIGQLDPEEIFYLKARGYSHSAAKNLLTKAFIQEVVNKLSILSVRNQIKNYAHNFLKV